MTDYKRAVAKKIRISDILSGKFVKGEGDQPSYLLTTNGDVVSRVNIVSVIVESDEDGSAIIDDGSGKIQIRIFNGKVGQGVGDFVLVIGRPREFNEIYISAEVVKKVTKEWADFRKKELLLAASTPNPQKGGERKLDVMINLIKNLDKGDGAPYEELVKAGNDSDAKKTINLLLERGQVFEVRPGKIKVLD